MKPSRFFQYDFLSCLKYTCCKMVEIGSIIQVMVQDIITMMELSTSPFVSKLMTVKLM